MHASVQHVAKRLHDNGTYAAEPFGERVCTKKNHAASFRAAERFADAAGVRTDKVDLQLADLFRGNTNAGEFAKASVDAIGGVAGGHELIYDRAGSVHSFD